MTATARVASVVGCVGGAFALIAGLQFVSLSASRFVPVSTPGPSPTFTPLPLLPEPHVTRSLHP